MSKRFSWSFTIIILTCFILFFSFNSEYFAAKPTVSTVDAKVLENSVTLNGLLKDGKKISQYGFKWGTTRSLSGKSNIGSEIQTNTEFSATISGLKAGNTYYYQAYALNSKGYGLGDIKSFKVPIEKNTAPVITISNPGENLIVNIGETIQVSANAQDDKKVEAMSLYINDVAKNKTNNNSLAFDWNTSGITAGEYKLKVTAWDGKQAGEKELLVTVQEQSVDTVNTGQTAVKNYNNSKSNSQVSRGTTSTDTSRYPLLSKVNGIFGQFRYRELGGGRIEVDPQWVAENIVTITLPGLNQPVQVHKDAAANFIQAFNYIKNGTASINGRQVSLLSLIETMDGTYVTRHVMWDASRGLSNHSWGTAIDINADGHFGYVDSANDPNMILWKKAFEPAGFSWGNRYSDSMHYELIL